MEIMDILNQCLGSILLAVLVPVATTIGVLLGRLIKRAISHIDNKILQDLAWQAVLFVEQKFTELHGKDKFDKAYEYIAKKLPGVDKEDIEKAIEAAVKAMNEEFPKSKEELPK
ncbi:MAG: phage holin [Candidatus Omnitrophica bacterium 4484_70.1]|nr:MAG: phage holin [Candidatus Omnitrophica bacterium 4484_70.1]